MDDFPDVTDPREPELPDSTAPEPIAYQEFPMSAPHIYQAIAEVTGELATIGIGKTRTNEHDRYKFRGIEDVYNTLAPLLAKHKLVILPRVLSRESVERASKSGGAMFYVTLQVEFDFVSAIDGSKHTVAAFGEAMDRSDKATNKAMSAAYKYAAFQAFCIPTEAQDADAETPEPAPHSERDLSASASFRDAIQGAATKDELADIGGQLASSGLPADLVAGLRQLYSQRLRTLKAAA